MRLTKALVAAAGMGSRLLPTTKEQPKEMLPIFSRTAAGQLCVKPLLQLVFEQLYDVGFREFCFVIGVGKRAIEDHFTQDYGFLHDLELKHKQEYSDDLRAFYDRLDNSIIVWVNQPNPCGFGDAVLKGRGAIGDDDFLVHAGDTYIISEDNMHYHELTRAFDEMKAEAAFVVKRMPDPKGRGVVDGEKIGEKLYLVRRAVEKPDVPFSDIAIEPIYIFRSSIFESLAGTKPGKDSEIQLTDAIARLIEAGATVYATEIGQECFRLDIGDPQSYWEALKRSYTRATRKRNSNIHADC
jgi:UTP--glucose-1-phosphate uridylyltransferase